MAEHNGGDNVHTRAMAEFISALSYDAIPQAVRERIKLLILDSLGCAIHGAHLPWCGILCSALAKVDTTSTTSVWGDIGASILTARRTDQRHPGARLRAR